MEGTGKFSSDNLTKIFLVGPSAVSERVNIKDLLPIVTVPEAVELKGWFSSAITHR